MSEVSMMQIQQAFDELVKANAKYAEFEADIIKQSDRYKWVRHAPHAITTEQALQECLKENELYEDEGWHRDREKEFQELNKVLSEAKKKLMDTIPFQNCYFKVSANGQDYAVGRYVTLHGINSKNELFIELWRKDLPRLRDLRF